ncbi:MAG: DUF3987 domain-containing protein [Bacteroidota bacterium]
MQEYTKNLPEKQVISISISDIRAPFAELERGAIDASNPHNKQATRRPRGSHSFPLDTLPEKAKELILSAKKDKGVPSDFLASLMVFAAGSATGNSCVIDSLSIGTRKAVFYMVIVGDPNTNKTGAFKLAMSPLRKRDKSNYDLYKTQKEAFDEDQAKPKKERDGVHPPTFKRVVISDITPEATCSSLNDSPRGVVLCRDELAGFIKDFNRYHQGGEQEFWLSNWSNEYLAVDRKGGEPIRVDNPFISITGTIQPRVIGEMAKDGRSANGFMDRFLFCWPNGLKKPIRSKHPEPLRYKDDYDRAINKLLDLEYCRDSGSTSIGLDEDARLRMIEFFNADNKPLCDNAESELLGGIYGKFDEHTIRIALALHLLHWAYSGERDMNVSISVATVQNAIMIAEYFRSQSLRVYRAIHDADPIEILPRNKRELYDALPNEFETNDGVAIAKSQGMAERSFKRFLTKEGRAVFEKVKHGRYVKRY